MNRLISFLLTLLFASNSSAHQPIMDMAPRWNDGYGIQTRLEQANSVTTTWVEGVYTFKPSLRLTLKIPYANDEIGNAIFSVPLKSYTNKAGFTSNWGVTPILRLPTATGEGANSDIDTGLSISYSSETTTLYQLYDVFTLDGSTGLDINIGTVHANGEGSSWFTLWDVSALDSDTGQRVLTGPVLVYFKDNIIGRVEYKFDIYDDDTAWEGNYFSIGIGWVY